MTIKYNSLGWLSVFFCLNLFGYLQYFCGYPSETPPPSVRQGSAENTFTIGATPQAAHLRNWNNGFDGQFRWGEKTGEWSMRQDLIVAQSGVAVVTMFSSDEGNDPQTNIDKAKKGDGVPDVLFCLEKGKFALLAH